MSEEAEISLHPRSCAKVVGHDDILSSLTGERRRRHHGLILSGPRGIGKASLAYRIAETLFARQGEPDMFGSTQGVASSPETALIRAGTHPDMMVIEPDTDKATARISVEQIRRVPPFLAHTPSRGRRRMVIIDSLDEMNFNGANAMLKTLEEPPEQALIILIHHCTIPLLPTIRSRCQIARISPLNVEDTRLVIRRIFPDADADWIDVAAVLAEGAPGRAQLFAETGAIDLYAETCACLASNRTSPIMLDDLAQQWGQGGAKHASRRVMMRLLFDRLARISAQKAAGYAPLLPGAGLDIENQAIDAITARVPADQLAEIQQDMLRKIDEAERLNLDMTLVAEGFLASMAPA
jgi:DNA polymerase-3 subunit delta'